MSRREQRELVFLLLFENYFNGYSLNEIREIKILSEDVVADSFGGFVEEYFLGVLDNLRDIDNLISKNSFKWGKDRLSKVSLIILRLAIYEMKYRSEIPVSVAINEAVELSKKYGADKESSFINGILGGISRDLEKNNE